MDTADDTAGLVDNGSSKTLIAAVDSNVDHLVDAA